MALDEAGLAALRAGLGSSFPFLERMGLEAVEVEVGRCVLRVPFDGNQNHFDAMYAGALYTLAEVPGGVLFLTSFDASRFFVLVKGSTIRYRRAARSDVTVEATITDEQVAAASAEADANGKADFDLTVELRDADGEVVAEMTSTYQLRTHGSLR
jgi:thioesterase domain-containing protein